MQETDANGYTRQFIRGDDGELLTYIDSDGNSYHTEYDSSGLITGFVYPDGGRTQVNYDPDGLVTSVVNPSGASVTFTYDSNDRVVSVQSIFIACTVCLYICLLYTSPSPRDATLSRMPSSA